jgi:hypothetical protein
MHSNPLWIGVEIVRETNTTSNLTLNVLESQICNLTQLVGMDDGCQPTKVSVCLEPDNLVLNMVVFPFATMLSSLLNCSILNKLESLVVNPHDRFGRFESRQGCTGSIDSHTETLFVPKNTPGDFSSFVGIQYGQCQH